jgi:hypothetical protein
VNKKFVCASHGLTAGLLAFNFLWAASSGMAQIQSATNAPTPSDYVCVNQGPKGVNE